MNCFWNQGSPLLLARTCQLVRQKITAVLEYWIVMATAWFIQHNYCNIITRMTQAVHFNISPLIYHYHNNTLGKWFECETLIHTQDGTNCTILVTESQRCKRPNCMRPGCMWLKEEWSKLYEYTSKVWRSKACHTVWHKIHCGNSNRPQRTIIAFRSPKMFIPLKKLTYA